MRGWDGDGDKMLCAIFQEKWDSMTRKWRDNCLLQLVRLFLIDEVRRLTQAYTYCTLAFCSYDCGFLCKKKFCAVVFRAALCL